MQIFLRTLTGKTVTLDVSKHDSIEHIKRCIQEKEGVLSQDQRLVFSGKELEDESTLDKYGIQEHDTLHLLLFLRGGSGPTRVTRIAYRIGHVKFPRYTTFKFRHNVLSRTFDLMIEDLPDVPGLNLIGGSLMPTAPVAPVFSAKSSGNKTPAKSGKSDPKGSPPPPPTNITSTTGFVRLPPPKKVILPNLRLRHFAITETVDPYSRSEEQKQFWFMTEPLLVPTYCTLINNVLTGFYYGYTFELELQGRGFRLDMEENNTLLGLHLGHTHRYDYRLPPTITANPFGDTKTQVQLKGYDLQELRRVIAELKKFRRIDPFKGKGVRLEGEIVKMKKTKRISAKK